MSNVTQILQRIEDGDAAAASELLPLVYEQLGKLAAAKMAQENVGHTLQATALVHDAYIRLVNVEKAQHWNSRGHFFSAAAEAMRRILIENARKKQRVKHGGQHRRVELGDPPVAEHDEKILALDEALQRLEDEDPIAARVVVLRFFAGLGHADIAKTLGLTVHAARMKWTYARAWLSKELADWDSL